MERFLGIVLLIIVMSLVTGFFTDLKATKRNDTQFKSWQHYVFSFIIYSAIALVMYLFSISLDLIFGL